MLVLSRKVEEKIILTVNGQVVELQVVQIDGNKVRLGVKAPREIAVHREEVWKRQAEFAGPADAELVAARS